MRIFVYEHITGGGLANEPLPDALANEGDLMLRALAHDLMDIPGAEVMTTRDARLAPLPPSISVVSPLAGESSQALFMRCCTMAEAVWPIAPESAAVLEQLSRIVIACRRILLGSRPDAVHTTGSKYRTAQALMAGGVRTVPTYLDLAHVPSRFDPLVIKPDDGAGCLDTWLMDRAQASRWWTVNASGNYVLQPLIEGPALSLSLLCHDGVARLLSVNRQQVTVQNGAFCSTGVQVAALPDEGEIYARLANQVAAAIPGLWGYAGIDFIQTTSGPVVVEINPRLTTAYAGLRTALRRNPAALVLCLQEARRGFARTEISHVV